MQAYFDKHHPGQTCKMIEGFRPAAYQEQLYAEGRTVPGAIVTYRDGVNEISDHQMSLAADMGVFDAKGAYIDLGSQDVIDYYGHLVRQAGLEWGGMWHKPDEPHAQWPETDHQTYESARLWQKAQRLV